MANGAISLPTSAARVLRFLAGGPASLMPAARVGKFMLEAAGRGSVAADADLLALLKKHFRTVKHAKPPASRKGSSEWYVVAQGFKGRG